MMAKEIAPGFLVETVGDILEGHNNPPAPTPFEAVHKEIDDLYEEARNWLDGEPVTGADQAEQVGKLRDMIREAAKKAESLRKEEARPFDEGKAEVQARYNPLIQKDRGVCDIAIKACNDALKPYLKKLDDEQRAVAAEARRRADAAAALAAEEAARSNATADLDARAAAEVKVKEAAHADREARALDNAKPQAGGLKKAIGLRSVWRAELVDPAQALAHYRQTQPAKLKQWLIEQANADVRAGARAEDAIPGFKIIEDRVPS